MWPMLGLHPWKLKWVYYTEVEHERIQGELQSEFKSYSSRVMILTLQKIQLTFPCKWAFPWHQEGYDEDDLMSVVPAKKDHSWSDETMTASFCLYCQTRKCRLDNLRRGDEWMPKHIHVIHPKIHGHCCWIRWTIMPRVRWSGEVGWCFCQLGVCLWRWCSERMTSLESTEIKTTWW